MCCAYARKVHCAVVGSYKSGQPCGEHDLFTLRSRHFMKEVGHFRQIFHREGGTAHEPLLASENQSDCRFVWYQNIRSASFSFVTIQASDRWTDRIVRAIPCAALHAVAR